MFVPSLRPRKIASNMNFELRRACIVGGNAISAFLSWRLQATNACDVTLVWKANYQAVAQYGISFKYVSDSYEMRRMLIDRQILQVWK